MSRISQHLTDARAWFGRSRRFPYSPHLASSALSLQWLVGGLTLLLATALSQPSTINDGVLVLLGVSTCLAAAAIHVARDRLPVAVQQWMMAIGSVLLAILVATGTNPSVSTAFSFFYLWIVLYALLFFSRRAALVQIGLVAVSFASAASLRTRGAEGFSAVEPLVLAVVITTTAVVVYALMQAHESASIDPLTELANRRGLDWYLDQAVEDVRATHHDLVVAIADVDNFKSINDQQGHAAGDQVLKDLSRSWSLLLRSGDRVGRFGGDEFVVVLPSCSNHAATAILERLRAATPDGVTCSIGAAEWHAQESVSMWLSRADDALYEAKRGGRDRLAWGPTTPEPDA